MLFLRHYSLVLSHHIIHHFIYNLSLNGITSIDRDTHFISQQLLDNVA